ncbi:MAG: hypothetical protein ACRDMV_00050 [Streptosporangiales bacterium]
MSTSTNGRHGMFSRPTPPLNETTRITGRGALAVLVSLGLAVAAIMMQKVKPPDVANAFAPSVKVQGTLAHRVHLRQGDLTLKNIRSAQTLQGGSGVTSRKATTAGIWLVIDYRFRPAREQESMDVTLYTRDHTEYPATSRAGSTATSDSIYGEPGFTQAGVVAFELPPQKLAGSTVAVGNDSAYGVPLWDTQAVIPLGIDNAQATELVQQAPKTLKVGSS